MYPIVGIVIVAGVSYAAGRYHKKIGNFVRSFRNKGSQGNNSGGRFLDQTAPTVSLEPQTYDIAVAKEEFVKKSFEGIYESMYRVAIGKSAKAMDVLTDWNTRMHYLNSCPNVQKFWHSLFGNYETFSPEKQKESAGAFLSFMYSTGIKREEKSQIKVDMTTRFKYYTEKDEEFTSGKMMNVKFACWTLGDKVLEKGILTLP